MRSATRPRFALVREMRGEIVEASKHSALKEKLVALDKHAAAPPLNRSIPPANPTAVGLLFKASQRYASYASYARHARRLPCAH